MLEGCGDVTALLRSFHGRPGAQSEVYSLLYTELRQLARRWMRRERSGHVLQPTALANEAYLRLTKQRDGTWENRAHFLAAASQAMRTVLVDYARARNAQKRGGMIVHIDLAETELASAGLSFNVIDLDRALIELRSLSARQARVIECMYFAGMTEEETGEVIGVSYRTIRREHAVARAWLFDRLRSVANTPSATTIGLRNAQ